MIFDIQRQQRQFGTIGPAEAQRRTGCQPVDRRLEQQVNAAARRAADIFDVPVAVSAFGESDLVEKQATAIDGLQGSVPNLNIVQGRGSANSVNVFIRGIGQPDALQTFDPGVGMYVDDVSYSRINGALFSLFDVPQVDGLRGPQGTLFGSGSVGGTIRYITNQPKLGTVEGAIEGNLNLVDGDDLGGHLKGAINIPMGDKAALRAVGYYTRYGGFIDAIGPAGKKDVNSGERYGGRLALLF